MTMRDVKHLAYVIETLTRLRVQIEVGDEWIFCDDVETNRTVICRPKTYEAASRFLTNRLIIEARRGINPDWHTTIKGEIEERP